MQELVVDAGSIQVRPVLPAPLSLSDSSRIYINNFIEITNCEDKPGKFCSVPCDFQLRDSWRISGIIYIFIYMCIYIHIAPSVKFL